MERLLYELFSTYLRIEYSVDNFLRDSNEDHGGMSDVHHVLVEWQQVLARLRYTGTAVQEWVIVIVTCNI